MYASANKAFLCLFLITNVLLSQEKIADVNIISDTIQTIESIDPLSPSRAAFYSAILPGLGQAYNKKYWKIPIVYGAIGTGVYFYNLNKNELDRYKTAYNQRINGFPDEFDGQDGNPFISEDGLVRAQNVYIKNRDLSFDSDIKQIKALVDKANSIPDSFNQRNSDFLNSWLLSPQRT